MELFVAEVFYDDGDLDVCTYEVGVFDAKDKAFEEADKFLELLIEALDAEDRRDYYIAHVWGATLNEPRKEL